MKNQNPAKFLYNLEKPTGDTIFLKRMPISFNSFFERTKEDTQSKILKEEFKEYREDFESNPDLYVMLAYKMYDPDGFIDPTKIDQTSDALNELFEVLQFALEKGAAIQTTIISMRKTFDIVKNLRNIPKIKKFIIEKNKSLGDN